MSSTDENVRGAVKVRIGDKEFEAPPGLCDRIDRACQIHGYDTETAILAFCGYGAQHRDAAIKAWNDSSNETERD
jgi:ribosomal protein L37E